MSRRAELGGFYFSLTMFLNQVGCWVCACLYLSYYKSANKIDHSTIYTFLCALHLFLALCLLFFFRLIKPEYRSSFYSTESGRQNAKAYFKDNIDDAIRVVIFTCNIDLWSDIAPDVMAWTLSNWSRWESEKPEWFTSAFKESIPDDMMPVEGLVELNKTAGGSRRRSSVVLAEVRMSLIAAGKNVNDGSASVAVLESALPIGGLD